MDHDDVLEQLELAAVEPGGLDRLVAGDTPMAAAVVGHLAGCERCAEELRRLSRAAPLLRDVVRTTPSADLRDRTLAYVREHGRPRGDDAVPSRPPVPTMDVAAAPAAGGAWTRRWLPWVATAAAVLALVFSGLTYGTNRDLAERLSAQALAVARLESVQRATVEISGDADAHRVELVSTNGSEDTAGTLLFSPGTHRLVVVAYELNRPAAGQE